MLKNIAEWFVTNGVDAPFDLYLSYLVFFIAVGIVAFIANWIAKQLVRRVVTFFVRKSKTSWDDILLERKVFSRLSHLAPALVFYYTAPMFDALEFTIEKLSMVYMMLAGLLVFFAFLDSLVDIYRSFEVAKQRPVKGYAQIIKIIIFIFVAIIAISTLMDRSPLILLSGLGAMTAVIILVFKDSILGLVASIQLSMNDMVRVGDWIEMPKFNADGDVIDISLHTIKVQNWDKTITTIPAYALISDSFKNWRGMSESGGRRIKRAINIDMNSIRFLDEELYAKLDKFNRLKEYLKNKRDEIAKYNDSMKLSRDDIVNGRHLTNIGTFRAYVNAYLKDHPKIHRGMTFMVRQLPPSQYGLPIEIYVFSNDQDWVNYEAIQSDIFDHILAIIPMFDLKVYQNPTGADFKSIVKN